jgi:hypothetical protein
MEWWNGLDTLVDRIGMCRILSAGYPIRRLTGG